MTRVWKRYQDLIPDDELVSPNFQGPASGWRGWISCAATRQRDLIMGYSEKDSPRVHVRGLRPYDTYELSWYDPAVGKWLEEKKEIESDAFGEVYLGGYPSGMDWAWKLKKLNTDLPIDKELDQIGNGKKGETTVNGGISSIKRIYIQDDSTK